MKEVNFVLQVSYKSHVVKMKATKSIALLLALNKLRKRKILFRRKMKNTLFMQKQDYNYCSGYVSQEPQYLKTRRSRLSYLKG